MTTSSSMEAPELLCPSWCQRIGQHSADEDGTIEHAREVTKSNVSIVATLWTQPDGTPVDGETHTVLLGPYEFTLQEAADLGFELSNIAFRLAGEGGRDCEPFMAAEHAQSKQVRR